MGRIKITVGDQHTEMELAAHTIMGRAKELGWRIEHPTVPSTWLEFRWSDRQQRWEARTTNGPGDHFNRKGRPISTSALSIGHTIKGPVACVELVDASPPIRFVQDLSSHRITSGDALFDLLEERLEGTFTLGDQGPLRDGDVFTQDGHAYRFHTGTTIAATEQSGIDLASHSWTATLDFTNPDFPSMTLRDGVHQSTIHGEYVHFVAVFVEERLRPDSDGFLLPHQVRKRLGKRLNIPYLKLKPNYAPDYRRTIRTALASQGVLSASALLEMGPEGKRADKTRFRVTRGAAHYALIDCP